MTSSVELEKVPMGQGVGTLEPTGQYDPAGHTAPVILSVGVAVVALRPQ